ncbi:MAG: hypothetical protein FJZ86_05730 [Chloroflexi bacterium]|nr:hypothetical protein [Chloroflexota bacterium]
MSTQNENLFVKLIKKSVGLPTVKSDCCGAPAGQSGDCCGANASNDCCDAEGAQASSAGCGCGSEGCGGDCCGAEDEIESESY